MVCLSVTCPAFLRLYHNPFLSDSQNYLLCSFLESRSFSLRAFVLHAGSWNSWELGSVVFSVTQWFPIVTLIREGEEPRVKGIIRERSDVNKSVSNQTCCSICRWRVCRKLLGNYNSDLQLTLFKPWSWKFSYKFASYAKIYKRDIAHFCLPIPVRTTPVAWQLASGSTRCSVSKWARARYTFLDASWPTGEQKESEANKRHVWHAQLARTTRASCIALTCVIFARLSTTWQEFTVNGDFADILDTLKWKSARILYE